MCVRSGLNSLHTCTGKCLPCRWAAVSPHSLLWHTGGQNMTAWHRPVGGISPIPAGEAPEWRREHTSCISGWNLYTMSDCGLSTHLIVSDADGKGDLNLSQDLKIAQSHCSPSLFNERERKVQECGGFLLQPWGNDPESWEYRPDIEAKNKKQQETTEYNLCG